ncbi:MAG: DUF4491 family protein [Muribaculaceae bacterium]|nr:DUF4491 family protein [Muribaculaceae bacterium]
MRFLRKKKRYFKCLKQHDSMQCGVTCLSMICNHYGREYSIKYLDRFCHANIAGVSMLGIAEGAKYIGFDTSAAKASIDELSGIHLPCILHWNQNHFVVLYDIAKSGDLYRIALYNMNYQGLLIGLLTFLIIGLFHPLVIKGEYYLGQKAKWIFAALGIATAILSIFTSGLGSILLGVVAFSSFWSILEVKEQQERVRKGWFPKNPKRK